VTIHINSLQDVFVFILAAIAVLGVVATLHWKIFAIPLLKKMIDPLAFGLTVTSRVVQQQHPEPFAQAQAEVKRESALWGGI
jgi:hypothetical protein